MVRMIGYNEAITKLTLSFVVDEVAVTVRYKEGESLFLHFLTSLLCNFKVGNISSQLATVRDGRVVSPPILKSRYQINNVSFIGLKSVKDILKRRARPGGRPYIGLYTRLSVMLTVVADS